MKTFIYTYSEKQKKDNGIWRCHKTVKVYWMKRGAPIHVGSLTETYVDQWQLFMTCAEQNKLMPKRAFEESQFGGYANNRYSLEDKGLARVYQIG